MTALLGVYSRPGRDPRGDTVSIVYVGRSTGTPKADDDAKAVALFAPDHPPSPLAFDHAEILADYVAFTKSGRIPSPRAK